MDKQVEFSNYEKTVLGPSLGIGLRRRGPEDSHVIVELLIQDNSNWFIAGQGFSSFFMDELFKIYNETRTWLNQNCLEDIEDNRWQGWKFKD